MSAKIFQQIPKIMSEVGAIEKGRKNQQQGYQFRGIDDIYSAFQPLLAKHGVFYVPEVLSSQREERQTAKGGTLIYTVLNMKFTFFADDGSSVGSVTVGEAMDSGDKSANKAMSAALKYALLQMFCIPTEEDNDTENHSPEPAPKSALPNKPKPQKPQTEPETPAVRGYCKLCGYELNKGNGDYYCPKYKDTSNGQHSTRIKADQLGNYPKWK